eukprot:TRINITY_DN30744_c0_g1_i1.p1 TRINITY_DN30744_c0_g1~~TRINITY_DN30744_c0_g1_i1.p1  ORF type:complete len:338 (+),score=58.07 TRINITY_DN30744_c0_g1_i1:32-1045(+)
MEEVEELLQTTMRATERSAFQAMETVAAAEENERRAIVEEDRKHLHTAVVDTSRRMEREKTDRMKQDAYRSKEQVSGRAEASERGKAWAAKVNQTMRRELIAVRKNDTFAASLREKVNMSRHEELSKELAAWKTSLAPLMISEDEGRWFVKRREATDLDNLIISRELSQGNATNEESMRHHLEAGCRTDLNLENETDRLDVAIAEGDHRTHIERLAYESSIAAHEVYSSRKTLINRVKQAEVTDRTDITATCNAETLILYSYHETLFRTSLVVEEGAAFADLHRSAQRSFDTYTTLAVFAKRFHALQREQSVARLQLEWFETQSFSDICPDAFTLTA